jgi:hypothetical protein
MRSLDNPRTDRKSQSLQRGVFLMEDIAIRFVQAHPKPEHIKDALSYPMFLNQWLTSQGIPSLLHDDAIAINQGSNANPISNKVSHLLVFVSQLRYMVIHKILDPVQIQGRNTHPILPA